MKDNSIKYLIYLIAIYFGVRLLGPAYRAVTAWGYSGLARIAMLAVTVPVAWLLLWVGVVMLPKLGEAIHNRATKRQQL